MIFLFTFFSSRLPKQNHRVDDSTLYIIYISLVHRSNFLRSASIVNRLNDDITHPNIHPPYTCSLHHKLASACEPTRIYHEDDHLEWMDDEHCLSILSPTTTSEYPIHTVNLLALFVLAIIVFCLLFLIEQKMSFMMQGKISLMIAPPSPSFSGRLPSVEAQPRSAD
jgi:hypothetical protein